MNCITAKGDVIEKEVKVKDFDKILIDCSANVYLSQTKNGQTPQVVVKAEESILDLVDVSVEGSELVVDMKGCIINSSGVKVFVSLPTIAEITADGSGGFSTQGEFIQDKKVIINIEGSGDADLKIITNKIEANIEGSGSISLDGEVESLEASIEGSGDIVATDCKAQVVDIEIEGSGDVKVYATKELNVSIEGSGDVKYKGDPKVDSEIDGSGDIKKL